MKKIKKYYPLIVGLVLLISVAAYGTRAYFSDSTDQEAGINLTLGNVKITSGSKNWEYVSTEKNEKLIITGGETKNTKNMIDKNNDELAKYIDVKNARPGDSFTKEFTFTNESTLETKLTVSNTIKTADSPYTVKFEAIEGSTNGFTDTNKLLNGDYNNSITLRGTEVAKIKLTVSVKEDAVQGSVEWSPLELMEKFIKVELYQANRSSDNNEVNTAN